MLRTTRYLSRMAFKERKLKLADLKQRAATETALLAVRLPGQTMKEIRDVARALNIRMRALVLALLNEGLDAYEASSSAAKSARRRSSR
jgi:hypothetical protein